MAPAAPTPRQLVERLKQVTGAETDEQLARHLNEPLRTIGYWNSGHGPSWETAIRLLDLAGWLQMNPEEAADDRADRQWTELRQTQIREDLEELVARLERRDRPSGPAPA